MCHKTQPTNQPIDRKLSVFNSWDEQFKSEVEILFKYR